MNREQTIEALHKIGAKLAKEYGYDCVKIGEDRHKGIWGEGFTKYLEKQHGPCTEEITWYRDEESMHEENVKFRYRFSSPCISIRQPGEIFCEFQFSDYDYDTKSLTGDFDIDEIIIWKRDGQELYKKLLAMWGGEIS